MPISRISVVTHNGTDRLIDDLNALDYDVVAVHGADAWPDALTDSAQEPDGNARLTPARNVLVRHISHDVRTPMNGIVGMAELLLTTRLDTRQTSYVRAIRYCSATLLTAIDDILELSGESAEPIINNRSFDLPELVATIAAQYLVKTGGGVELVISLDPAAPCELEGDPVRVTQLVSHLINKGLELARRGPVRIRFSCKRTPRGDMSLEVAVACDSEQLAAAPLPSHGEGDAATQTPPISDERRLVLLMCQRLAKLMGGALHIQSENGHGPLFSLSLPTRIVAGPALPLANLTGKRLLAFDRCGEYLSVLAEQSAWLGIAMRGTSNRSELAAIAREWQPDLIALGDRPGIEEAFAIDTALRAAGVTAPRVVVMGLGSPPSRRRCEGSGIVDGIERPVSATGLAALLQTVFGDDQPARLGDQES